MLKPGRLLRKPVDKPPSPPTHLEKREKSLWTSLVSEFDFGDAASQVLLETALEAHMRARRCRVAIDRDGEAVTDRLGQVKPHPLLAAERDASSTFITAMKVLNLDLGGDGEMTRTERARRGNGFGTSLDEWAYLADAEDGEPGANPFFELKLTARGTGFGSDVHRLWEAHRD